MKSIIRMIAVFTATMLGTGAFATTRVYNFPGALCHQATDGTGLAPIAYSQFGVHCPAGLSGFGAEVRCPLPMSYLPASADVTFINVLMYDRSSRGLGVLCTVIRTDGAGQVTYSVNMNSSTTLNTGLQNIGTPPPAGTTIEGYWSMSCYIAAPTSNGASHMVAARLTVNE